MGYSSGLFAFACNPRLLDVYKRQERLPNSYPGIQRATKGAAYAFKARIAIYNEDYAAAATAAKNCMDLNVYKLHSNYQDLFTASWSDEWIFFFRGDVTLKKYYWAASDVLNSISRLSGCLLYTSCVRIVQLQHGK